MASRNINSFFSKTPATVDIPRSRFKKPQNIKLTFNNGNLIPFYWDTVYPGDTFSVDTSKVVRMSTPIAPIMDNIWLDTYYFFVPYRIIWEHWKEFMGENSATSWIPQVQYSIPQITSPTNGWNNGTIADYLGIPTKIGNLSVNALPIRAYCEIFNEWFRDENLTDPTYYSKGDATVAGSNGYNYVTDLIKGGYPAKAAKLSDVFTHALPAPQKGPDVALPLGQDAVVYPTAGNQYSRIPSAGKNAILMKTTSNGSVGLHYMVTGASDGLNANTGGSAPTGAVTNIMPVNLVADLTTATGTSINQLRTAFQIQKLFERDARGGTRYIELIKSHFGVSSPDSRMQRPEYLGGNRVPVNIHQVVQTSSTDSTSPQGHTGAYSLTIDTHSDFTKSFTEHGIVMGILVTRADHTYQQGLEREWSRKTREDYYFPVMANLGEFAILNKEIYAQGSAAVDAQGDPYDDQVFGYQEAWYDLRQKSNRVAGQFRSNATGTLDFWHLADNYSQLPALSDSWIREDFAQMNRVLTVGSSVANQFIADIMVMNKCVRPIPLYSIPGLIDHH